MLTHRNMISNIEQARAWVTLDKGTERVITALPLYHIFSLTANFFVFMSLGGCNILITNPKDIPGFIKTLKKTSFTAITGVNTLFNAVLNHTQFKSIDFSRLKLTLGGGMAVQQDVATRWKATTGCPLLEAYGLTEASPAVCVNPLNLENYNGSIGLPLPSTHVQIVDEQGNKVPTNEVGELWVKGPQIMKGYWQQDEETQKVITRDGWLKTGDMSKIDTKGYVYIVSRKKDMILVSGFNVYPNEIEDVVMELPTVQEAAAIGIPDAKSGEVVKLFVVPQENSLTKNQILAHCKKHLTGYKIPKEIVFKDELPKTNVGKVLHRALRDNEGQPNPVKDSDLQ